MFFVAKGAITSAAKHQLRTIMRMAAMEAKEMAKTVKTLYPLLMIGPWGSISEIGVKATPSIEDSPPPSVDPVVAGTGVGSGAPARRIFRVFFWVTVEESAVGAGVGLGVAESGGSDGITESGIRDVLWLGMVDVFDGDVGALGLAPEGVMIVAVMARWGEGVGAGAAVTGDSRSVGRLRRIVLGVFLSAACEIGTEDVTPMAESNEIREVLDFVACNVEVIGDVLTAGVGAMIGAVIEGEGVIGRNLTVAASPAVVGFTGVKAFGAPPAGGAIGRRRTVIGRGTPGAVTGGVGMAFGGMVACVCSSIVGVSFSVRQP